MTVEGDQGPGSHETAQTRGFLFADLRGYTEYVERHGASAAADLLARYRAIVRATVAEHRGAEIRTEGDSFFIVLPTASAAVRCALSIVERVEAENARQAAHAIRVGIGIHAGESIETSEGLVGSAVNIAARLSALARPGEVLMSETVRALTRSVIPVRYIPRGKHRLKGVAEPQEVFAAVPAGAAVPVVNPRFGRPLAAAVGVVALAVVLVVIYVSLPAGAAPLSSPTPSSIAAGPTPTASAISPATPSASAFVSLPAVSLGPSPSRSGGATTIHIDPTLNPALGGFPLLETGSYRWPLFQPDLIFQIDASWTDRSWYGFISGADYSSMTGFSAGGGSAWNFVKGMQPGMVLLSFVRLQTVLGNPCDPGDTSSYQVVGGRPRDVVNWLSSQRFLAATNVQPVALAGWTGLSVDITVKGDPGKVCAGLLVPHAGTVHVFKTTPNIDGYSGIYQIDDGSKDRFTVLDIGGDVPLVFAAESLLADFDSRAAPWSTALIDTITVLPTN